MLKKLNRLWYANVQRLVKQQGKRVRAAVKKMGTKPRATPARQKPAGTKAKPGASTTSSRAAVIAAMPGDWTQGSFKTSAVSRRMAYRLFLPARAAATPGDSGNSGNSGNSSNSGYPLLVMLHGCEQDAASFAAGTRMNALAAAKGYAVLYPEQSLATHPRRCWKWYDAATQHGDADVGTIACLVDDIASQYGIDRQRIYVCGISAGAAMAHILALTHPALIAAVGMHSGPVFGACRSAAGAFKVMQQGALRPEAAMAELLRRQPQASPLPAIIIGGKDDHVVRAINLWQLERQFLRLNQDLPLAAQPPVQKPFGRASSRLAGKRKMHVRDYRAGRKLMLRAVEIEGLGHAWSGGDDSIPYHAKGPDASRLMLDFFARHRKLGAGRKSRDTLTA